ncbi:MAG: DNA/RNA non-specific endonuclease [Bacteroides sp.]|nr:DNA/RNA non-specific endonuclease [Bacteroides sp.]MCM1477771.1 DNA/RNA non-specific endonuclease [Bacteroides sp.]
MKSSRKKSSNSRFILGLIFCAVMVGAWQLWANTAKQSTSQTPLHHGEVAKLMEVKTNPKALPDEIIAYTGMTISFNPRWHEPNWVAWELTGAETMGTEKRQNKFYCDENVVGCAEHYDYNYSGYDRGHMAPAADMKWSEEAMHNSFSMANICPQAKSLNTGAWKRLEEKCRTWAQADSAIIIICGPITTDTPLDYIGDTRIAVPQRFFKVILSPFASPMRGIGFIMPNDRVPGGMQAAAVSIDEVERVTGHDFFSSLPDDIENDVESQCDFHFWSTLKP